MTWNTDEKQKIFTIITKICELEKAYGLPEKDAKAICRALEAWLKDDFVAEQVSYAVEELVKQSVKVPMPDEIRAFLNPVERKITVGEYLQAKRDWIDNGKQQFCNYLNIIKKFDAQNQQEDEGIERRKEYLASLGYNGHKIVKKDDAIEIYLPKKFSEPNAKAINNFLKSIETKDENNDK
jgi:hypothetical protein